LDERLWQAALWDEELFLAVNVSPRQLLSAELVDHVKIALEASRKDWNWRSQKHPSSKTAPTLRAAWRPSPRWVLNSSWTIMEAAIPQ
jgi:hypothetical protein